MPECFPERLPALWRAELNPSGPNYEWLAQFFPAGRVPIASPQPVRQDLGAEKDVEVYVMSLEAMPLIQRARVLGLMAQALGVSMFELNELKKAGFPIRAADVIVSFDLPSQRAM